MQKVSCRAFRIYIQYTAYQLHGLVAVKEWIRWRKQRFLECTSIGTFMESRSQALFIYTTSAKMCVCVCVCVLTSIYSFYFFPHFNTKFHPSISFALQIGCCNALEALKHQAKIRRTKTKLCTENAHYWGSWCGEPLCMGENDSLNGGVDHKKLRLPAIAGAVAKVWWLRRRYSLLRKCDLQRCKNARGN